MQSSVHHGCQRDSFWLPSCMCTSTAHASLLPAAERATRPTANISTPPRCSASARKWRVQPSSMSLSDCLELLGEQAQMYPQGTRKASKVGCKAHRAQLRTHQNAHCSNRTEEYTVSLRECRRRPRRRSAATAPAAAAARRARRRPARPRAPPPCQIGWVAWSPRAPAPVRAPLLPTGRFGERLSRAVR